MRGLLGTILLAGLVFVLISTSFQNFRVEGDSMKPNVTDGEFVVVNKAAYRRVHLGWLGTVLPFVSKNPSPFGSPKRGEVIVFERSGPTERDLIKRVIGLPGETIELRRGVVYINGQAVEEKYIARPSEDSLAPQRIPPDSYFVMGDNRVVSFDSRSFGPIPRKNIIGKAWFSYWPTRDFGLIKSSAPSPASAKASQ